MSFKAFWGDMNFGDKEATAPLEVDNDNIAGGTAKVEVKVDKNAEGFAEEEEEEEKDTTKKPSTTPEGDEEEEEVETPKKKKEETKPSDEEESFSEEDIERSFHILDSQGVLELDDNVELEATPEGIAEAVAMTVRKKVDAELETAPPAVKSLYNHLRAGKAIEDFDFVSPPDPWSEMNEDDEDNQRAAVEEFLLMQGVDPEDLEEEVEDIVSSGKLEKKSQVAFKALIKKEEEDKETSAKAKQKTEEDAAAQAQKEIEDIKSKIDSAKTMASFKMTDDRKKEFKDYLFKVNKKTGKTQFQENMHSDDRKLKIAFMDFIEFTQDDIAKEIESDLTKKRARTLTRYRSTRTKNTNNSTQTVQTQKKSTKGNLKIPSIFSARRD